MVRMKSFLHLVLVFLSCISYFSPDFNSPELLLKYHCKELSQQSLGLTNAKHFKLTLEWAVTETVGEDLCGALGKKPVLDDKKIWWANIILKWLPFFCATVWGNILTLTLPSWVFVTIYGASKRFGVFTCWFCLSHWFPPLRLVSSRHR